MAYFLTRDNPNRRDGVSSDFYMACKHNDINKVRDMIPNRTIEQLNQIESNGGTSLHAAIYYGYPELVELLLQCGCNPDIEDRHQQTARDNIRHKQIRDLVERYAPSSIKDPITPKKFDYNQLFNELNQHASDKDDVPIESIVTVYMKPNDTERQSLLERILRVRWKIYSINRYKIPDVNNCSHIRSIFKKYNRHRNDECKFQYEKVDELLTSFEETKNVQHLLELYRATNSLEILHHDSIQMEMYAHLQTFSCGNFQGHTYHGRVLNINELLPFQWAFQNPGSILELRQFTSTLLERSLAEKHIEKPPKDSHRLRVLFIYDISKECYTAIDIDDAPNPETKGIRLLSGTFLEVTNIQQYIENGRLEIYLKTVPLPLNVIIQATRELEL
jgi:hypothetical protein